MVAGNSNEIATVCKSSGRKGYKNQEVSIRDQNQRIGRGAKRLGRPDLMQGWCSSREVSGGRTGVECEMGCRLPGTSIVFAWTSPEQSIHPQQGKCAFYRVEPIDRLRE